MWKKVVLGLLLLLVCASGCHETHKPPAAQEQQSGALATQDVKEGELSIKEIMNKAHGGRQSLYAIVWNDLHRDPPNWPRSGKNLAEMTRLCSLLTKREPPRGTRESWESMVRLYLDNAKAVQENLEKEDVVASRKTYDQLLKTCKVCHNAHKPPLAGPTTKDGKTP
jgi:hypothetical protein